MELPSDFLGKRPVMFCSSDCIDFPLGYNPCFFSFLNKYFLFGFLHDLWTMNKVNNLVLFFISNPEGSYKRHIIRKGETDQMFKK